MPHAPVGAKKGINNNNNNNNKCIGACTVYMLPCLGTVAQATKQFKYK
jgi:hypothetical protein